VRFDQSSAHLAIVEGVCKAWEWLRLEEQKSRDSVKFHDWGSVTLSYYVNFCCARSGPGGGIKLTAGVSFWFISLNAMMGEIVLVSTRQFKYRGMRRYEPSLYWTDLTSGCGRQMEHEAHVGSC
jgi:hypothetical protein